MPYSRNSIPEGAFDRRFFEQELRGIEDAIEENPINNVTSGAPTVSDDVLRYQLFSKWIDTATNDVYMCVDTTSGAAVWRQIG
jgi:hypothetical protein